ncbi:reverse transcriptase domain-containing protein, partial [Acinetobacter terrae]|uniref:reverse transcriptase domain-containing protein n=1 Tax=Acinetobacter terrae TaxID=2731247 RepID=UPI001EFF1635
MSDKELKRLSVLQEICDQRITQSQAAQLLHISERQIRRLLQKYKAQGPAALAHAARDQTSNCKLRQGDLEYTQGQDRCDDVVEEARLHAPSASESPYGKMRPLGIPTMKCRAMQALHLLALEPIAETTADPNSYGLRPQRSTADAAAQCFGVLSRKANAEWVLEGDIEGCFDNISHDWMIANIPMDKMILRKWLKAGYVYQSKLFPSLSGTPQGGIISSVLANMTLDGLETMLAKRFPNAKWTGKKLQLVRYADDFIITGYSKEWLENEVRPAVVEFLAERGL